MSSGETSSESLKQNVGRVLAECLHDVAAIRPSDPIEYIAQWLYKYADNREYYKNKSIYTKALRGSIEKAKEEQRESFNRKRGVAIDFLRLKVLENKLEKGQTYTDYSTIDSHRLTLSTLHNTGSLTSDLQEVVSKSKVKTKPYTRLNKNTKTTTKSNEKQVSLGADFTRARRFTASSVRSSKVKSVQSGRTVTFKEASFSHVEPNTDEYISETISEHNYENRSLKDFEHRSEQRRSSLKQHSISTLSFNISGVNDFSSRSTINDSESTHDPMTSDTDETENLQPKRFSISGKMRSALRGNDADTSSDETSDMVLKHMDFNGKNSSTSVDPVPHRLSRQISGESQTFVKFPKSKPPKWYTNVIEKVDRRFESNIKRTKENEIDRFTTFDTAQMLSDDTNFGIDLTRENDKTNKTINKKKYLIEKRKSSGSTEPPYSDVNRKRKSEEIDETSSSDDLDTRRRVSGKKYPDYERVKHLQESADESDQSVETVKKYRTSRKAEPGYVSVTYKRESKRPRERDENNRTSGNVVTGYANMTHRRESNKSDETNQIETSSDKHNTFGSVDLSSVDTKTSTNTRVSSQTDDTLSITETELSGTFMSGSDISVSDSSPAEEPPRFKKGKSSLQSSKTTEVKGKRVSLRGSKSVVKTSKVPTYSTVVRQPRPKEDVPDLKNLLLNSEIDPTLIDKFDLILKQEIEEVQQKPDDDSLFTDMVRRKNEFKESFEATARLAMRGSRRSSKDSKRSSKSKQRDDVDLKGESDLDDGTDTIVHNDGETVDQKSAGVKRMSTKQLTFDVTVEEVIHSKKPTSKAGTLPKAEGTKIKTKSRPTPMGLDARKTYGVSDSENSDQDKVELTDSSAKDHQNAPPVLHYSSRGEKKIVDYDSFKDENVIIHETIDLNDKHLVAQIKQTLNYNKKEINTRHNGLQTHDNNFKEETRFSTDEIEEYTKKEKAKDHKDYVSSTSGFEQKQSNKPNRDNDFTSMDDDEKHKLYYSENEKRFITKVSESEKEPEEDRRGFRHGRQYPESGFEQKQSSKPNIDTDFTSHDDDEKHKLYYSEKEKRFITKVSESEKEPEEDLIGFGHGTQYPETISAQPNDFKENGQSLSNLGSAYRSLRSSRTSMMAYGKRSKSRPSFKSSRLSLRRSVILGQWYYSNKLGVLIFDHPVLGELRAPPRKPIIAEDLWATQDACRVVYDHEIYSHCDSGFDDDKYSEIMLKWTGDMWKYW